jgi:hypothetical protein
MILFKFKILIKVILKYKLQTQQVKRIQKGVELCVWEKVRGRKSTFAWEKILKERFVLKFVQNAEG